MEIIRKLKIWLCAAPLTALAVSVWADEPPLHPVEAYCASYDLTGVTKGTMTTCQRSYGHERYERWDTKTGIGPFRKHEEKHVIFIGEWIYTFDGQKAVRTANPVYKQVSERMKRASPDEMQRSFLDAMQYKPTEETKEVNGVTCTVNKSKLAGSVCLTSEGIVAEQKVLGQGQKITALRIGDSGDAGMYDPAVWDAAITDGPDIGKILEKLDTLVPEQN